MWILSNGSKGVDMSNEDSFIKITADFCISHGDEFKTIGIGGHILKADIAFWGFDTVMERQYERATKEMQRNVKEQIAKGTLGENAHLVTHPHDK